MAVLVLDSEPLALLTGRDTPGRRQVRSALTAAARLGRSVSVPAVVLAELYREPGRNQLLDALLSREVGFHVRSTDRAFARLVGGVLRAASAGSELMVDAHVVATAVERGGGVVLTGDPGDLGRLADPYASVVVVGL